MLRKLLFLIILILLSFIAAKFADSPGDVRIDWMGYRIETSFFFLAILTAMLVFLFIGVYSFAHVLMTAPREIRKRRREKYHARGLDALTKTFIALASDDTATAGRMLQKADKMLDTPAITLLLSAQLAKLQGDETRNRILLQKMLKRKETAFLAARNLLEQTKSGGSVGSADEALGYARKMVELQPKNPTAIRALIENLAMTHKWQEGVQLTEKSKRRRILKADEANHILAILYYNEGKRVYAEGDRASAMRFLQRSHKLQPDFVPAATLLAKMQYTIGRKKEAIRSLRHCWKLTPHPDILSELRDFYPEDDAEKWLKRVEKFVKDNPEHRESLLARSEAEIAAKRWKAARNHLKILLSTEETVALCKLMSELERGENADEEKASKWLLRAASADPDPAWICVSCANVSEEWDCRCPQCSAFDSIKWTSRSLEKVNNN